MIMSEKGNLRRCSLRTQQPLGLVELPGAPLRALVEQLCSSIPLLHLTCMQLGLRLRLRGRHSLYDLIRQRSIDRLSVAAAKLLEELPAVTVVASTLPLPASPTRPETSSSLLSTK